MIYASLLMGIMAVGQLKAMDYDLFSDCQEQWAVNVKRFEGDKGYALYVPSCIDLIEQSIPESRQIMLSNAEGLSDEQLSMVVRDLGDSLRYYVPECHRTGTGEITKWHFAGYHEYDDQYKSSQEILALSEQERRKAAEEKLLTSNYSVIELSDKYDVQTMLPVYLAAFNAAESTLCVPEIHEENAHRLADVFLKGTDKNTLKIWLRNDQIKQVDRCLSSLTKKSHDLVLKYMNHPKMQRNNDLPAETVKQAAYLQVLHLAPNDVKQKALCIPEIRNALAQYTKAENLDKINKVYPRLQEIKEEAEQAFIQQIKERDKWSK